MLPASEGERSPGAIEPNVDKLAADRFKKRGMGWRQWGADHMCQIIELEENGEVDNFIPRRRKVNDGLAEVAMASLRGVVRRDPVAWLKKDMPLLRSRS